MPSHRDLADVMLALLSLPSGQLALSVANAHLSLRHGALVHSGLQHLQFGVKVPNATFMCDI